MALWRKYLIAREQGLGATEALDVDARQTRARKTFELLRSAPPTQCVDALLILGFAAVVASWDASEQGDTDGAWLNLLAAEHAEGQIQGILIVAENSTLSGSLQRKKSSAKSKTDYDRLLARARAIKAQKPKFSRPRIANFLSKYGADGNRKAVGGEFDLKPATILKRLQGLDLVDK